MISTSVRAFLGCGKDVSDKDIIRELKKRQRNVCKPCWELKYCPYGALVEEFPLRSLTMKQALEHNEYLRKCLKTGRLGTGKKINTAQRRYFETELKEFNPRRYVDKEEPVEVDLSCKVFGHFCPVFFTAESATETWETRIRSRSISTRVKLRVARRDNSRCQSCGVPLLDHELEFDHIIPVSKGGSSNEHNVRLTCFKCNREKQNNLDESFVFDHAVNRFLSEESMTRIMGRASLRRREGRIGKRG